jgi:hypothetical protein
LWQNAIITVAILESPSGDSPLTASPLNSNIVLLVGPSMAADDTGH